MKNDVKWKDFVYQQVVEFCNMNGSRTFSLKTFLKDRLEMFEAFKPNNKNIEAKIRQQLQFLRDDGKITFLDNSGHYTLRGISLLVQEAVETNSVDLSRETPEKREYLVETYVRNVAWAKLARQVFGEFCLIDNCNNTFLKEDGSRYIEVHHIIPLCDGGEDGVWNLSVLCAHHHKMAHYGDMKTKSEIKIFLLKKVENIYRTMELS